MLIRLPVHCCCTPAIRLGTVPMSEDAVKCGPVRFVIPPRMSGALIPRAMQGIDGSMEPKQTIHTVIEQLELGDGTIIFAVKSAHLDVDVWKQVPGFQPER